jgi:hypothetical protein
MPPPVRAQCADVWAVVLVGLVSDLHSNRRLE